MVVNSDLFEVLFVVFFEFFVEFFDGDVGADVLFEFVLKFFRSGFVLFHLIGGLLIDKHELSVLHAELLFVFFELADFEFEEGHGFGEVLLVVD